MDPLEKQLLDMSGIKEEDAAQEATDSSVLNDTQYTTKQKNRLSPVRTFNSDLADAVRAHGGSVVRIAIAEDEKRRREIENTSIGSKKNITFIVAGIILVIGALSLVWWGYEHKQAANVVVPVIQTLPTSLIPSDAVETLDIGGMQVGDVYSKINTIAAVSNIQPGQIKNIILTKTVDGNTTRPAIASILTDLGTHAPDTIVRALSDEYMLGVYQYDQGNLFLVMHGTAHDFLLTGMLAWEPYLFNDVVPLFKIDTSSFTKMQLQTISFTSGVISNHEARVVFDANKKPLLYYSFLDQNTILMAIDPKTLTEIVRRF